MSRLVRDAVLIAVTAVTVWVIRGDAQTAEPVGYGQQFQLVCLEGSITNVMVSQLGANYTFSWYDMGGESRLWQAEANLTRCAAYPDLRTPTP